MIETGPKPNARLPWYRSGVRLWDADHIPVQAQVAEPPEHDVDVLLFRVNNWDALIAERNQLDERLEAMEALARAALDAANPNREPWRCEAFAKLDAALKGNT